MDPLKSSSLICINPVVDSTMSSHDVPEIESNPFLPSQNSPGLLVYQALRRMEIINFQGSIAAYAKSAAKYLAESYRNKMKEFLMTPLVFNITEINKEILITLREILDALSKEGCISIDVLHEEALFFWGYELIDLTFKEWGLDLLALCGEEYVTKLRASIEKRPSHLTIHTFINAQDAGIKIDTLKRALINCLSSKIKLDWEDESSYTLQRQEFIKHLHALDGCQYMDWLRPEIEKHGILLPHLLTTEFLVQHGKESAFSQIHPIGKITLTDQNARHYTFVFASAIPEKQIRYDIDTIRAPLRSDFDPLQLQSYDPFLIRGIVDIACGIQSPYPVYSTHITDWKKWVVKSLQGSTSIAPHFKQKMFTILLQSARECVHQNPEQGLGEALAQIVQKVMNKESSSDRNLALLLSTCGLLLGQITPLELQEMIDSLTSFWTDSVHRSSFSVFKLIRQALREKIPYVLIESMLQLSAIKRLEENHLSDEMKVYLNHQGSVQLELTLSSSEAYTLFFPLKPIEVLRRIYESIDDAKQHLELLQEFINTLSPCKSNSHLPYLQNLYTQQFMQEFPSFFHLFLEYLKKLPQFDTRRHLFLQFCGWLRESQQLTSQELLNLNGIENEILDLPLKNRNFLGILLPILRIMGQSLHPQFNKMAYVTFLGMHECDHKFSLAQSLCTGSITNAINTFLQISKESTLTVDQRLSLFEKICINLQNHHHSQVFCYIDILAWEIEQLVQLQTPLPYVTWLSEQLTVTKHEDLAKRVLQFTSPLKEIAIKKKEEPPVFHLESIVEQVKHIIEKNRPGRFYKALQVLKRPSYQPVFKENSTESFNQLFLPTLEEAFLSSPVDSYLIAPLCFEWLKETVANSDLIQFANVIAEMIGKIIPQFPLPKNIRQALFTAQPSLFEKLYAADQTLILLSLTSSLQIHQIDLHESAIPYLLKSCSQALEHNPSKIMINMIYQCVKNRSFPSSIFLINPIVVQLIDLFISSAELIKAIEIYRIYAYLIIRSNHDCLLTLIEACQKLKDRHSFVAITECISKPDSIIQNGWEKCFINLANLEESESVTTILEMILPITKSSLFTEISLTPLTISTLSQIIFTNPKEKCPYAELKAECFFPFVLFHRVTPKFILIFYQFLRYSDNRRLQEIGWEALTVMKEKLPERILSIVWHQLIYGLSKTLSEKYFKALEDDFFLHRIVQTDANQFIRFYSILFEKLFFLLNKQFDLSILLKSKTLFKKISALEVYKTSGNHVQMIQLYYAGMLSKSPHQRDLYAGLNLFIHLVEIFFKENHQGWPTILTQLGKQILNQSFPSFPHLHKMIPILIEQPHLEFGLMILSQIYRNYRNPDCKHDKQLDFEKIGILIEKLFHRALYVPIEKLIQFKENVRKLKLVELLEHLSLHTNPKVSLNAFLCLNKAFLGNLMNHGALIKLIYQSSKNFFSYLVKYGIAGDKHYTHLNNTLNLIQKELSSNQLDELLSVLFHVHIQFHRNEARGLSTFIDRMNQMAKLFNLRENTDAYPTAQNRLCIYMDALISNYLNQPMSRFSNDIIIHLAQVIESLMGEQNHTVPVLNRVIMVHIILINQKLIMLNQESDSHFDSCVTEYIKTSKKFIEQASKQEITVNKLKEGFSLYDYSFIKSKNEDIDLPYYLNSLLEIPLSDGALLMGVSICANYLNELNSRRQFFHDYLNRLTDYVAKIQTEMQAYNFGQLTKLIYQIYVLRKSEQTKELHKISLTLFQSYIQLLKRQNLKLVQSQMFIKYFPSVCLHLSPFLKKYSQVYLNGIKVFNSVVRNFYSDLDTKYRIEIEINHNKLVLDHLVIIPFKPDCLENRACFINSQLAHLMELGVLMNDVENYRKVAQEIFKEAFDRGIYEKFKTKTKLYKAAKECVNSPVTKKRT